jgi:hypothetical protein
MIQRFLHTKRTLAVLCLLLALLAICTPAFAQLDYDTYDIYQGGVLVGTIYVPERSTDQATAQSVYAEYWILFPNYIYPSEKNPVTTQIAPATGYHYTSVQDFFTKAPWGAGCRFVNVIAVDSSVLPGRAAVGTTAN